MKSSLSVCALIALASPALAQITVQTGMGSLDGGNAGANRFRHFGVTSAAGSGAGRNYLGISGLGAAPNRTETNAFNFSTGANPVTNHWSFSYEPANDRLVSTVQVGTGPVNTLLYPNFLANVATLPTVPVDLNTASWNAMELFIVLRSGQSITLSDVRLNGDLLPTSTFNGVMNTLATWQIWGHDFRTGFTLSGKMDLVGTFSTSQENSTVNFKFGNDSRVPTPGAAGALALAGLVAARRRRGA